MASPIRSSSIRSHSIASSELSQPSPGMEAHIQRQMIEEASTSKQQVPVASTGMDEHDDDYATKESISEEEDESSPDRAKGPVIPIKRWRARDIEAALGLTTAQGRAFHQVVKDELEKAGLFGTMEGACARFDYQEGLRQVVTGTKIHAEFLQTIDVSATRLDELILARARICNENEKHNDRLVRSGRVRARAGTAMSATRCTSTPDHITSLQQLAGTTNSPIASRTRNASRGRRATPNQPSVIADTMSSLSLAGHSINTVEESQLDSTLTPSLTARPRPIAPVFSTSIFHPTAFLIRLTHSTTGAAIHTSQLASAARRESGSTLELQDMDYRTFLDMVSSQVGFEVEGRIEAVIPKVLGTSVVNSDAFVKLEGEEEWLAVLQMWTNARRRTCEFIVDRVLEQKM
ncbi:hypothetical protein NX059_008988 [Plenodomus lindquistii]|nr:hypothetical protein NX059_008988 [Plenodomus lindquistii]